MFAPLSTHATLAGDAIRASLLRVRPGLGVPALRLSVDGGLHDRCDAVVERDGIRIGAGPDSDLVLLDPHVAGEHVRIAIQSSFLGPLARVSALGGALEVDGATLEPGETSRYLRLPIAMSLGEGVTITLGRLMAPPRLASSLQRLTRRFLASGVVLSLMAAGLFVLDLSSRDALSLRMSFGPATDAPRASTASAPQTLLGDRLDAVGLGHLRVRDIGDFISVEGRLAGPQRRVWTDVAVWYDGLAASKPLLARFRDAAALPKMPPVSLVRHSAPKAIILSTGEALTIGAPLSDGWMVDAIERDHIVIARGEDRETLRFSGAVQ